MKNGPEWNPATKAYMCCGSRRKGGHYKGYCAFYEPDKNAPMSKYQRWAAQREAKRLRKEDEMSQFGSVRGRVLKMKLDGRTSAEVAEALKLSLRDANKIYAAIILPAYA